jgi:hypothetical protein
MISRESGSPADHLTHISDLPVCVKRQGVGTLYLCASLPRAVVSASNSRVVSQHLGPWGCPPFFTALSVECVVGLGGARPLESFAERSSARCTGRCLRGGNVSADAFASYLRRRVSATDRVRRRSPRGSVSARSAAAEGAAGSVVGGMTAISVWGAIASAYLWASMGCPSIDALLPHRCPIP